MAKIKITSECPLYDGMSVTFKAPCDCTAVDGINVYYGTIFQTFSFRDSHGSDLTGIGNLFTEGAYVKAILDTGGGYAYLQNADTNAYLEQILDELVPAIKITSFTHDAGTQELGAAVESVYFTWTTSKAPASLTLDGEEIDKEYTGYGKGLMGLSAWRETTTFELVATDERGKTGRATTTLAFYNGIYYGAAAAPAAIDSAFVMGLHKTLSGSKNRTVKITGGDGLYAWYAYPKRLGKSLFNIGGFDYEYELETIPFTNSKGYTEDYYVYRSGQYAPASLSVTVKDGG